MVPKSVAAEKRRQLDCYSAQSGQRHITPAIIRKMKQKPLYGTSDLERGGATGLPTMRVVGAQESLHFANTVQHEINIRGSRHVDVGQT
jgi:hypothetical protein